MFSLFISDFKISGILLRCPSVVTFCKCITSLMYFFPPLQVKETGEVAIAGGYVDLVPALAKPSAQEPVMVGGSNRSLNLHRSLVRLYFCEKTQEEYLGLLPILFAVFRGVTSSEMLTLMLFKIHM